MGDQAWKTREDAVLEVGQILSEVKRIQPAVGELLNALKARLGDSNRNLAAVAAKVIGQVATAMGPPFERQVKLVLPPLLKGSPRFLLFFFLSFF
jgi:cytoskeleton-associated protein 5